MTPWLWLGYVAATGVGIAACGVSALLLWMLWHVVRGWIAGEIDAVGAAEQGTDE